MLMNTILYVPQRCIKNEDSSIDVFRDLENSAKLYIDPPWKLRGCSSSIRKPKTVLQT